jgi:hypothetical protein
MTGAPTDYWERGPLLSNVEMLKWRSVCRVGQQGESIENLTGLLPTTKACRSARHARRRKGEEWRTPPTVPGCSGKGPS